MIKRGSKKAQVTIFVLIAIVLVVGVLFYFMVMPKITRPAISAEEAQKLLASQIEPIKEYTQDCVKATYTKCTETIGFQGGYYKPTRAIQIGNYSLPYLVYKDGSSWVNNLPLLTTIGRNIDECLNDNMDEVQTCINDFKTFREIMDISKGQLSVMTLEIQQCAIVVDVNYPLTLSRSGSQTTVDKMPFSISVCVGQAYNTAAAITNSEFSSQTFDMDTYTIKNPNYAYIERQGLPTGVFYYIETFPLTDGLSPYSFHFGIQR